MKRVMLIAALVFLSACGERDLEFREDGALDCEYQEQSLGWDQSSPEGVVVERLLAIAEIQVDAVPAEYTGSDNTKSVSFEIARRGNNAFYMESEHCAPRVELPLVFSLQTEEDDLFDEVIELRARELDGILSIEHFFGLSELVGSFSPVVPQGSNIRGLSLNAILKEDGGEGRILVHIEEEQVDGSLSDSAEEYWSWTW